jgi:hypothetical protein
MKGIQFLVDEKGEKKSVLIDLTKHSQLWEDFYDSIIAKKRAKEPRETLDDVKKLLKRQGKLRERV